jgi:hypothetical protein
MIGLKNAQFSHTQFVKNDENKKRFWWKKVFYSVK